MSAGTADRKLERILSEDCTLDSDQFEITSQTPIGQGTWALVFPGHDKDYKEEVAIKLHVPTDYALAQMEHQKVTSMDVVMSGRRKRMPARHLVITEFHRDKNGRGFLVMERYSRFFNQVLDEASQVQKKGRNALLPSGLSRERALKYLECIVEGVYEFHTTQNKAHCDLKPDNIAVDPEGHLLLADFGSSTYTSFGRSNDPRDNKGWIYIRSPRQFQDGAHPAKSSDIFSVGSLAYKMFTGKYFFQDEIDKITAEKGQDAVKEWMRQLQPYSHEKYKLIEKKLKHVPEYMQAFIHTCVAEEYRSGIELKSAFRDFFDEAHRKAKEADAMMHFKLDQRIQNAGSALIGMAIAGIVAVLAPYTYLRDGSIYQDRQDTEAIIAHHDIKKTDLMFQWEQNYPKAKNTLPAAETRHEHDPKEDVSATHILADAYTRTAEELGYDIRWTDFKIRANAMTNNRGAMHGPNERESLQTVIEYAIGSNMRDSTIDLEDTLTIAHLGLASWKMAVKDANSADFTNYQQFLRKSHLKQGSQEYEWTISPEDQRFVQQWAYNVKQALPRRVLIDPK